MDLQERFCSFNHYMFYEPDYDTGYTALAIGPIDWSDKKLFKKYKLL